MGAPSESRTITVTRRQDAFLGWVSDVLVYIVVLNLFVEFVDSVVIDSFWVSILTAVLIKALLAPVMRLEHAVHHAFFEVQDGTMSRVLGLLLTFSVLFLSKLLILEIVNYVFGDHVELGHFIEVAALIISMIAAAAILRRIYARLGESSAGLIPD